MLPTKKSEILTNLKDYLILVYGRPKTGKTTLAAQFDDPLFLSTEPGTKSISVYRTEIKKWKQFTETVVELEKEKNRFKTVVLDTFPKFHDYCLQHICEEMGIDYPSDAGHGKAWSRIDQEFNRWMTRLTLSERGVVLLAHADTRDIEQSDGTVKSMTTPKASKQATDFINRSVDLCAFYYFGKHGERYLRISGTDDIVAGNRIDGHFVGINKFAAGGSAKDSYKNFLAAFNNQKNHVEVIKPLLLKGVKK